MAVELTPDAIFEVMFWHEKTYQHEAATTPDGWRCLDCDARMPQGETRNGR